MRFPTLLYIAFLAEVPMFAQQAQPGSVLEVIPYSQLTSSTLRTVVTPDATFSPTTRGTVRALFSVYTNYNGNDINNPANYKVANTSAFVSALSANIATSLSLIPLSSPTSGVILKKDPLTGADLPASATLGPIFTQRAETVGKGNWYVGVTYQDYHFGSLDGAKLNGLPILYKGNDPTGLGANFSTAPATFNMGLDVRLSQELAFVTYGVTNRFDVSLGLPMVHSAVSARSYNGVVYSGTGTVGVPGANQFWAVNTLTPGSYSLAQPEIGSASLSKTGIGDLAVRLKGQVIERPRMSLAAGVDLRFATGDETNYLGTGTTSAKPFFALSLYTPPLAHGIVFAPHLDAGWQFSGKSVLGGGFTPATAPVQISQDVSVPVNTNPFTFNKDYLPDVFSWSVGTEVALGRRSTVVLDIIGNQIGTIHGIQLLSRTPVPSGFAPPVPGFDPMAGAVHPQQYGYLGSGRGSYGQYSGAFGYKFRIYRDLVASFQALVRFDDNGLTARFVPLFGFGYSR